MAAEEAAYLSDPVLMSIRRISGGIVIRPRSPDVPAPDAESMTGREHEVQSRVAEGFSDKLVAAELGTCERAVKDHPTSTMTKLKAADRTLAMVTAVRLGWPAIYQFILI